MKHICPSCGCELTEATLSERHKYLAYWRYSDNSSSGIFPRTLNEDDKNLLELACEHFGFNKDVEFVQIPTSPIK